MRHRQAERTCGCDEQRYVLVLVLRTPGGAWTAPGSTKECLIPFGVPRYVEYPDLRSSKLTASKPTEWVIYSKLLELGCGCSR